MWRGEPEPDNPPPTATAPPGAGSSWREFPAAAEMSAPCRLDCRRPPRVHGESGDVRRHLLARRHGTPLEAFVPMDTSTSYLGLKLPHPFIAGASPMGYHLDGVKRLEDAGCAAIVLPSIFEEQITQSQAGH